MTLPVGLTLLTSRNDVLPFIPNVIAAADNERESFGFLPARAYEDFALQRRLIIARAANNALAGYVVFGGTAPQARIFQTYVSPDFRRIGLARALVNEVVQRSENEAFLSIRVEVASDLLEANEFYKNCGFRKVREKAGGVSRNRTIWTRVRELNSPSLLDFAAYGVANGPPINLVLQTASRTPLYLVDLNVMFDVTKKRGNALGAGRVFAAALDNAVSLAVASEFIAELERNIVPGKPDPTLEFARTLPRLKAPAKNVVSVIRTELAPLLFPERCANGQLSVQDESDILHLATAMEENADGFVTSEKAILGCGEWFRANHNLEVISPEVFGKRFTASTRTSDAYRIRLEGRSASAGEADVADNKVIRDFLNEQDTPDAVIRAALSQGTSVTPRRRILIRASEQILAFGSWTPPKGQDNTVRLYLFADETDPSVDAAVDHIIEAAARDVANQHPAVLQITPPSEQVRIRNRLVELGFRPKLSSNARNGILEKLCVGCVVTEENWTVVRSQLLKVAGIELPIEPPLFRAANDQINLRTTRGQHATTALGHLEDFISPTIFALRGRPAAIVPIRPDYAEALFHGSVQPSLLNYEQAALLRRRRYFSDIRTYNVIAEPGLIFFYESSGRVMGRSAAIAIARVVRRYIATEGIAASLSNERGVLSTKELENIGKGAGVCVTEFDNLMFFADPVPLLALKALGCADDANMVTARALNSEATLALISAGKPACIR